MVKVVPIERANQRSKFNRNSNVEVSAAVTVCVFHSLFLITDLFILIMYYFIE